MGLYYLNLKRPYSKSQGVCCQAKQKIMTKIYLMVSENLKRWSKKFFELKNYSQEAGRGNLVLFSHALLGPIL